MGQLSLLDFRGELDLVFGDRSLPTQDAVFNRWINFGYLEVATAIDFEELDAIHQINTADGTQGYAGPVDPLAIKMVRDQTSDRMLDWVEKQELYRKPTGGTDEGAPLFWSRDGTQVVLHPVPDGVYNLEATFKQTPTLLADDADPTELQSGWDQGIIYFAVSHGYMVLGEENRGVAWYNKGLTYAQSRMTEQKFQEGTVGLKPSQGDFDPGVNIGPPNTR